jgi:hypothetical protein
MQYSLLPILFLDECAYTCYFDVLIQPLFYDLDVVGAPIHKHVHVCCQDLVRPELLVVIGRSYVH